MTEQSKTEYKINSDNTAAVSKDVYWDEDMKACPLGVTVFLLGAGGVATCSRYDGDTFWVGWFPALKRRPRPKPEPKQTLEELEDDLVAMGYDLDQLDKDNPYN